MTKHFAASEHSAEKKKKSQPDFAVLGRSVLQAIEESEASKHSSLSSGLYLVATPIGNLGDISLRALWTLQNADAILCEDTRVTGALLHHYGIKKPLVSCHDHNEEARIKEVLSRLKEGQVLALVSDAGTPLISDPGYKLVRASRHEGYAVTALPGASALLAALCGAGLPTDSFVFAGFLPSKKSARRKSIEAWSRVSATLVFYESPQRLASTLEDLADICGQDCRAAVAREITKLYEEITTTTLGELATLYRQKEAPKGEIVILVESVADTKGNEIDIEATLVHALESMSLRDAVAAVTKASGLKKSDVYARALLLVE